MLYFCAVKVKYFLYILVGLNVVACGQEEKTTSTSPTKEANQELVIAYPYPEDNVPNRATIDLGKMLFFEPQISKNGLVSCGTCHLPQMAFTDGLDTNRLGVTGKALQRHTPSILNLAVARDLFWDGRAASLEELIFMPMTHPDEMAADTNGLAAKVLVQEKYKAAFAKAYGNQVPNNKHIAMAMAQYVRHQFSRNAKFDKIMRREPGYKFTAEEGNGFRVFNINCSNCHSGDDFSDHEFHNIGTGNEKDWGRFQFTKKLEDKGKFKTPTLRNIAQTAPYMHDGSLTTLEAVLAHYQEVQKSPLLDKELIAPDGSAGIFLKPDSRKALIAFLHTLTDSTIIK